MQNNNTKFEEKETALLNTTRFKDDEDFLSHILYHAKISSSLFHKSELIRLYKLANIKATINEKLEFFTLKHDQADFLVYKAKLILFKNKESERQRCKKSQRKERKR